MLAQARIGSSAVRRFQHHVEGAIEFRLGTDEVSQRELRAAGFKVPVGLRDQDGDGIRRAAWGERPGRQPAAVAEASPPMASVLTRIDSLRAARADQQHDGEVSPSQHSSRSIDRRQGNMQVQLRVKLLWLSCLRKATRRAQILARLRRRRAPPGSRWFVRRSAVCGHFSPRDGHPPRKQTVPAAAGFGGSKGSKACPGLPEVLVRTSPLVARNLSIRLVNVSEEIGSGAGFSGLLEAPEDLAPALRTPPLEPLERLEPLEPARAATRTRLA